MKKRILIAIKCIFLGVTIASGFLLYYAGIWISLDLPSTWWTAALLAVLSALSGMGLILWIAKEEG